MFKRVWRNSGPYVALLALFIALDGPAYAAKTINGALIKASTITSKQVKNESLTGADLKAASVDGSDIKDGSIGVADLAPGVIPAPAAPAPAAATPVPQAAPSFSIADGSLTTAMFATDAIAPLARALPGLRTETTASSPNIIGGASTNSVTAGVVGATIGGGEGNTAGANYATVPGGQGNRAAGAYSLAAGRRARVFHQGSFVWADSADSNFNSSADNQVAFRAANGMLIASDAGGSKSVPVGTRYGDNAIVAWGRVTDAGVLDRNFNVAAVTRVSTGRYHVVLNSSLQEGFTLIPTVTVESDPLDVGGTPPTGAANVRLVATNQVAAGNNFDVYVYNGSFALADNDFQFIVTGR